MYNNTKKKYRETIPCTAPNDGQVTQLQTWEHFIITSFK